jgi:Mg-chelatase subunit ChlD
VDAICLPDCQALPSDVEVEDLVDLLPKDRLIRSLAEEGWEGVSRLLRSEGDRSPELARRIERLRERLRREASRSLSRLATHYQRRLEELEALRLERQKAWRQDQERLRGSLGRGTRLSADLLASDANWLDAVRSVLVVPPDALRKALAPPRPSWWARLLLFLRRIWAAIRSLFRRGSPRRSGGETASPAGRPLLLATLASEGRNLTPETAAEILRDLTPEQREVLRREAESRLRDKARSVAQESRRTEEELRRRRDDLQREEQEARERERQRWEQQSRGIAEEKVREELRERGYLQERQGRLAITYHLIERFARLLWEEQARQIPGLLRYSFRGGASTGIYEKGRLRESVEVARLDIVSSLLASRLAGSRRIREDTSLVHREVRSESLHAVLLLDVSGSMAERGKLEAAKKALLALYAAIRRRYPDALIDVAAFDNEVRVLDLLHLWETPAGSFTNTAEALRVAHELLRSSRATRKEVYLITDGLPESYTDARGQVHSGQLDRAMAQALQRARELRTVTPLDSTLVLLRSENPAYEVAARELARTLQGKMIVTDPQRLAFELLMRFTEGQVLERTPSPSLARGEEEGLPRPSGPEYLRTDSARERRRLRRARARAGATPGG